jgi:hypothetical protein
MKYISFFVMLCLTLALLLQVKIMDVSHDLNHHHAHHIDFYEHALADVDLEGNPHDPADHNHLGHHHHTGDFFRTSSDISFSIPSGSSLTIEFEKDAVYSNYCLGPILKPPSRA